MTTADQCSIEAPHEILAFSHNARYIRLHAKWQIQPSSSASPIQLSPFPVPDNMNCKIIKPWREGGSVVPVSHKMFSWPACSWHLTHEPF